MPVARSSIAIPFAVACLGIATFSCMDAVMKGLAIALGAYNAMLWRAIAGLVMGGALFLVRRERWPEAKRLGLHAQRSVAAGCSVLLFFWGLVRVPMAEGVALTFLAPIIATLLAALMLGERVRRAAIFASVIAFAGVMVIVAGRAHEQAGPAALHGALAIILASLFYGYNLVLLRRSALVAGPVEITFFTNLVFVGLYGLGAPLLAVLPAPGHIPAILLAAALAIASSLMLSWAYARAEAQILASVEYTALLWSAILGALVFGEVVMPPTLIGAGMIIAGCLIAARRNPVPAVQTEAAL